MKKLGLFSVCVLAGLLVEPVKAASTHQPLPTGPWRLWRLFEPVPTPQRGYEVWALEADLAAAAKKHGAVVAVTTLWIDQGPAAGQVRKLTYGRDEYDCKNTQVRAVSETEVANGKARSILAKPEDWNFIMPHSFAARAFPVICEGSKFDDLPKAETIDDALKMEQEFDRNFAAGE